MKHLIPILLLLAPLLAGAQESDTAAFIRPPYLHRGDTVGIVSPAGKLPLNTDTAKNPRTFRVVGSAREIRRPLRRPRTALLRRNRRRTRRRFAGDDRRSVGQSRDRLPRGYGSVRLLPLADLARLREEPKWVAGFSDITMLHLALRKLRIESIHGPMPSGFRFDGEEDPSAESLRQALFGETECIEVEPHPLNQPGTASGRLAGGNLTVSRSADGTPEELTTEEPTVLLIEEVGEFVYRIDRIMQSLARSGKLENLRAVVVGHFSEMLGMEKFGVADACAIISSYTRPLGIPVVFGFPAGHEDPNLAIYLGRRVTVSVDEEGARMEFAPAD